MLAKSEDSFNRTFMELKDRINADTNARNRFQSHLYGIESVDASSPVGSRHQVSIAPLWN